MLGRIALLSDVLVEWPKLALDVQHHSTIVKMDDRAERLFVIVAQNDAFDRLGFVAVKDHRDARPNFRTLLETSSY